MCSTTSQSFDELWSAFKNAIVDRHISDVLVSGVKLLAKHQHRLQDEQWTVMEEVYLASLEHRQDGWAQWCYNSLHDKFGDSVRIRRLRGMGSEALLDWDAAIIVYKHILQDKADDVLTRKRLIALLKSQRRTSECVEHLNRHLEEFISDSEAWQELCELYLTSGSLGRGIFCFEELLSKDPRNIFNCITYAELNYSTGNVDLSRKYFCLACSLDPCSPRALWGLLLVTEEPLTTERSKKAVSVEIKELTEMAATRLISIYSRPDTVNSPISRAALALIHRMKVI
eukprot:GHVS01041668.1.p1 GENE.GHVS01041668.1~~GHVS01041668.1.p1  ORF type:complete len:285 (-),score=33.34 GHVS01041668.1:186-1040(-)